MIRRGFLMLALTAASAAAGQDVPLVSPPPLVPAEPLVVPVEPPPPAPEPEPAPPPQLPPAPEPRGVDLASAEPEGAGRGKRIGFEALVGGLGGIAMGVPGGWLGCTMVHSDCSTGALFGAAIGVGVAVPIAVLVIGNLFEGDGAVWAVLLGDLAGLLIGAASVALGGWETSVLLLAAPLGGAILGYETTSVLSTRTEPSRLGVLVTPTRGGGLVLGLAGLF